MKRAPRHPYRAITGGSTGTESLDKVEKTSGYKYRRMKSARRTTNRGPPTRRLTPRITTGAGGRSGGPAGVLFTMPTSWSGTARRLRQIPEAAGMRAIVPVLVRLQDIGIDALL